MRIPSYVSALQRLTLLRQGFGCTTLLILALNQARATDPIWTNTGAIFTPPQIDATTVINYGLMSFSTDQPFETSNTENYTNFGTMTASPGWNFETAPAGIGSRRPAASFANES